MQPPFTEILKIGWIEDKIQIKVHDREKIDEKIRKSKKKQEYGMSLSRYAVFLPNVL